MTTDDEWDDALHAPAGKTTRKNWATEENKDDDQPPEPVYDSVEAWVTDFLAPHIRRPTTNGSAWCPQWWNHAEAVSRLDALWRSWEFLRLDGTTGMSVWWRDHLDPHLGFLRDRDRSPFAECSTEHVELPELPVVPAPPDWWGEPTGD